MPKLETVRRIDLKLRWGEVVGGYAPSGADGKSGVIDDSELVRRDGTHSLYGIANWFWEMGAKVAGVFQSWGYGLVQVIGALYAGRRDAHHAGIFSNTDEELHRRDYMESADLENTPFWSTGAIDGDPDSVWWRLGYEGFPGIWLAEVPGQPKKQIRVDPEVLARQLDERDIDWAALRLHGTFVILGNGVPTIEAWAGALYLDLDNGAFYLSKGPEAWEVIAGGGLIAGHVHQDELSGGQIDHGLAHTPDSMLADDHPQYLLRADITQGLDYYYEPITYGGEFLFDEASGDVLMALVPAEV